MVDSSLFLGKEIVEKEKPETGPKLVSPSTETLNPWTDDSTGVGLTSQEGPSSYMVVYPGFVCGFTLNFTSALPLFGVEDNDQESCSDKGV